MAATFGIEFPLLSDPDLVLAKQFAGVSDHGYPLPSVYLLRPDGLVYLSKIGEAKDDRLSAAQLLVHLDAMQGDAGAGMPAARGYEKPYRLQAAVGLGGYRLEGEHSFAADLSLTAKRSFGRYVVVGAEVGGMALPDPTVRGSLLLQLQVPILDDLGDLYVQAPLGLARRFSDDAISASGVHHGLRLGANVEWSPTHFLLAELALDTTVFTLADEYASATRILFRTGMGWRF